MAEYIEREAAMSTPVLPKEYRRYQTDNLDGAYEQGWNDALNNLKNAPAADVAPVVRGRWDGDTCTVCKLPWNYNMVQDADDWGYFDPMPDYCPNCGAKLDGGEGDEAN